MNQPTPALLRLIAAAALLTCAGLAQAQYVWIDEKGLKQLSDKPPPTSVPLNKILKVPRGVPGYTIVPITTASSPTQASFAEGTAPATAAAEASASASAPKAPPTLAERNADYKKRATEKAKAEEKEKEDERIKKGNKENCDAAKSYKASLDSGERIKDRGADGENTFMSDERRAAEARKVRDLLAQCEKM
jgi:hypothetical protein